MKLGIIAILLFIGAGTMAAQQRDSLVYCDSSRITTTYSRIYVGPNAIQKYVTIGIDTTLSTQTVVFVDGPAADTNNVKKVTVLRLNYHTEITITSFRDTIRLKTLGGSVPATIRAWPSMVTLR